MVSVKVTELAVIGLVVAVAGYARLSRRPERFREYCWLQLVAGTVMLPDLIARGAWPNAVLAAFYVAISVGGLHRTRSYR